jgi:hypothetical protein
VVVLVPEAPNTFSPTTLQEYINYLCNKYQVKKSKLQLAGSKLMGEDITMQQLKQLPDTRLLDLGITQGITFFIKSEIRSWVTERKDMVAAETLTGLTEYREDIGLNEGLNLHYDLSPAQRMATPSQTYEDDYDYIDSQVFEDMAAEEELTQSEDASNELY